MVASSGARLLRGRRGRSVSSRGSSRSRPSSPRTSCEAQALAGLDSLDRPRAGRAARTSSARPRSIVTGGHGEERGRPPLRRDASTSRSRSSATTSRRPTAPAARTPRRSRRCSPAALSLEEAARGAAAAASRAVAQGLVEIGAGDGPVDVLGVQERDDHQSRADALRALRERRPLVHQITNYVVMNETANATLALGALPVMAHAREEVEEMVGPRRRRSCSTSARSRSTGSRRCCSPAGRRTRAASRSCSTRSAPARRRTAPRPRGGSSTRSTSRCCAATRARSRRSSGGGGGARRRVDRRRAASRPSWRARRPARSGSSPRSPAPSTTSPTASAVLAVANGHELLASVTGTGCMSTALTGCFLAVKPEEPLEAAAEALAAFGVAGEDAARGATRPRQLPRRALRRARGARPGDARREGEAAVRLHAARRGPRDGAAGCRGGRDRRSAAAQGRDDRGARSRRATASARSGRRSSSTTIVDAALELGADGRPPRPVRRRDRPSPRGGPAARALRRDSPARRRSPSAAGPATSAPGRSGRRRRSRMRTRRSGSTALRRDLRCRSVSPWSRSAASTPANAADCIRAGAAGVAVIRAAGDARRSRAAVDAAL